jgi:hypothetical protein
VGAVIFNLEHPRSERSVPLRLRQEVQAVLRRGDGELNLQPENTLSIFFMIAHQVNREKQQQPYQQGFLCWFCTTVSVLGCTPRNLRNVVSVGCADSNTCDPVGQNFRNSQLGS